MQHRTCLHGQGQRTYLDAGIPVEFFEVVTGLLREVVYRCLVVATDAVEGQIALGFLADAAAKLTLLESAPQQEANQRGADVGDKGGVAVPAGTQADTARRARDRCRGG